ncbi:hypothetical protein KD909_15200 (plasmid) [Exiguobacterium sp. PFWT01]|uniref:hypothetical protein n=1 Tax=Exiguobacterium sp. PFWT01 TaxID=2829816 RepID=UPI001BAAF733|nr:hypothetical protein [Exiguobacterium sp. PFWT01]QUP88707.1 hypothetical protein KD909_15200 [Exiguobacterium sp. PFWT01]
MNKLTCIYLIAGMIGTLLATLSGPCPIGLLFVALSVLCGLVAMINELVNQSKELIDQLDEEA